MAARPPNHARGGQACPQYLPNPQEGFSVPPPQIADQVSSWLRRVTLQRIGAPTMPLFAWPIVGLWKQ